jgi:hypothetical protein
MYKTSGDPISEARHLVLVAVEDEAATDDRHVAPRLLTTTRCRPSELPTTVALRLTDSALRRARAATSATVLDLETWVRLAVEAARQASRAADLLDLPVEEVVGAIDRAAAVTMPVRPVIGAPMNAYLRSLREPSPGAPAGADRAQVIVYAPCELATAWTMDAIAATMPLNAWASLQVLSAPGDVVSWEVAAARRGCYLGEWVLAAALEANRSSARPQA